MITPPQPTLVALALLLTACGPSEQTCEPGDLEAICEGDDDGDGYREEDGDCDDADPQISPVAVEICDGVDNDCDQIADDGFVTSMFWPDRDQDGYGDASVTPVQQCDPPDDGKRYVQTGTDCDDGAPSRFPGNAEVCDGLDNDCNDLVDDGVANTYWPDRDQDGYGDQSASPVLACTAPPGHVDNAGDCADGNPQRNPGRTEICDGIDNNCFAGPDDGLQFRGYYPDGDGDGYGRLGAVPTERCAPAPGESVFATDCNDNNPGVNPTATEQCDQQDWNCNGDPFDGMDAVIVYPDLDEDSFGDAFAQPLTTCTQPPAGMVTDHTDCNDANAAVNPSAPEICDDLDNNCSGTADDPTLLSFIPYYPDLDGDDWGDDAGTPTIACAAPPDSAPLQGDCNDDDATIYDAAPEVCDDTDHNCNGDPHDGFTFNNYYPDSDGDGYGRPGVYVYDCAPPDGYGLGIEDCDDTDPLAYPDAPERCNGADDDCDDVIDNDTNLAEYWPDGDGDGHGNPYGTPLTTCNPPPDYIATEDPNDCDDEDPAVNPSRPEICFNGFDDNCDFTAEDQPQTGRCRPRPDFNGDGYADLAVAAPYDSYEGLGVQTGAYGLDRFRGGAAYLIGDIGPSYPVPPMQVDGSGATAGFEGFVHDGLGEALAWGDLNHDGYDDLILGTPNKGYLGTERNRGQVLVYYGTDDLTQQTTVFIDPVPLDLDHAYVYAGLAVASGDLTGDGVDDLIFSAPGSRAPMQESCEIFVYPGEEDNIVQAHHEAWIRIPCPTDAQVSFGDNPWFGSALAVGDYDGDGFPDLAIAAQHFRSGEGAVWIQHGDGLAQQDNGQWLTLPTLGASPQAGAWLGAAITACDLDQDGHDDLLVSAPRSSLTAWHLGQVWAISGDGLPATTVKLNPPTSRRDAEARWGSDLACGDLTGDGYPDAAVSHPRVEHSSSEQGVVELFHGGSDFFAVTATQPDDSVLPPLASGASPGRYLPRGIEGMLLADIDGDDHLDLAVGATGTYVDGLEGAGAAVVYGSGADGIDPGDSTMLSQSTEQFGTPLPGERFGYLRSHVPADWYPGQIEQLPTTLETSRNLVVSEGQAVLAGTMDPTDPALQTGVDLFYGDLYEAYACGTASDCSMLDLSYSSYERVDNDPTDGVDWTLNTDRQLQLGTNDRYKLFLNDGVSRLPTYEDCASQDDTTAFDQFGATVSLGPTGLSADSVPEGSVICVSLDGGGYAYVQVEAYDLRPEEAEQEQAGWSIWGDDLTLSWTSWQSPFVSPSYTGYADRLNRCCTAPYGAGTGVSLASENLRYVLTLQADQDLVLVDLVGDEVLWSAGTVGTGASYMEVSGGYFSVYAATVVWSIGPLDIAWVKVTNDGRLVAFDETGAELWSAP